MNFDRNEKKKSYEINGGYDIPNHSGFMQNIFVDKFTDDIFFFRKKWTRIQYQVLFSESFFKINTIWLRLAYDHIIVKECLGMRSYQKLMFNC